MGGTRVGGMNTSTQSIQKKFTAALDDLIAQVKQDRSILAAILCGSLSHDTVWAKSDIDLALVTVDDKKLETTSLALYADGVNVHAFLLPRAEFRKTVEGSVRSEERRVGKECRSLGSPYHYKKKMKRANAWGIIASTVPWEDNFCRLDSLL